MQGELFKLNYLRMIYFMKYILNYYHPIISRRANLWLVNRISSRQGGTQQSLNHPITLSLLLLIVFIANQTDLYYV